MNLHSQFFIASITLCRAFWSLISSCQSILHTAGRLMPLKWLLSHAFLDEHCPWSPFLSTSDPNHCFCGFLSLSWSGPTPPVQSQSSHCPAYTESNLYCQSSVKDNWYILWVISSLILAFSKHIHLLLMKPSLVLLNLIFYYSEFIGICDMCSVMVHFILLFEIYMCPPTLFSKGFVTVI